MIRGCVELTRQANGNPWSPVTRIRAIGHSSAACGQWSLAHHPLLRKGLRYLREVAVTDCAKVLPGRPERLDEKQERPA